MAKGINKITAIDLFSGAGGFSLGMEQSGINVKVAIEFDSDIAKTYSYNHPDTIMINEDIRNIKVNEKDPTNGKLSLENEIDLEDIDLIFGGPPCQGFSMSGYRIRKNNSFFDDDRNKLFLDFYRFVKYIKPKVFIIENVPGILNYDNGSVKDEIYTKFSDLGYNISSKIFSAENFGVPQKRKRALFIGNNLGLDSHIFFPEETHTEEDFVTVWDAISDLPALENRQVIEPTKYTIESQTTYQESMRDYKGNLLNNHVPSKHTKKTIEILKMIKPGQTMKDLPERLRTKSVHSGAYGRMEKNQPSYTITTRLNTPSVGKITHPIENRTITPREAARLQSFPDNYKFLGNITTVGIQIGNSVPPILAKAIGDKIYNVFNNL